jgi:hypothetical protein
MIALRELAAIVVAGLSSSAGFNIFVDREEVSHVRARDHV